MINSFLKLKSYCEAENFSGWDPYDGLNSRLFQATPLKHWDLARLIWIQAFKRSPINFRKLCSVPKSHNNMGLGLFLLGYCELFRLTEKGNSQFGSQSEILATIEKLGQLILNNQSKGYSGSCWGYDFDWQARRLFLFPSGTPNVVVTAFCVDALFQAYLITKNLAFRDAVISASAFVENDLSRTSCNKGVLFSYSPLQGNNTVYNASLLGAKILMFNFLITGNKMKLALAGEAIDAAIFGQEEDGSWVYGQLPLQNWKDSFHTGFNLNALQLYHDITKDSHVQVAIKRGTDFYLNNFFLLDGTPKYYHNRTFPIDIHCSGQLLISLRKLKVFYQNKELADRVLGWTVKNMQDRKGFFYYQLKKFWSSKISYMRWSNAFMFYAMSCYFAGDDE